MEISERRWKVHYKGMKDEDRSGILEKYVPLLRLARTDKLSMRQCDRLTIRMCPPKEDPSTTYEFGATVDAWLNNGW
ncbi:hypothetical protein DCAR_0935838 [Daucus carota subsp. sativus]|uniref:Uncharacterized protein n=1 Tax=Daucus carota subsp. sativus TaxID=79200 RepID=A0A175YIB5_DAUCS|nr:hypothetical protein DCAR_0935838 [Daucus carota subsp. sativus]